MSLTDKYKISYAQNREDIILEGFFPDLKDGFYIDVGASHPDNLSVTKLFYKKGWRGINIEPIPRLYKMLTVARPEDTNLNLGIADKPGSLVLREYTQGDGLSTFSKPIQSDYTRAPNKNNQTYKDYEVRVERLDSIFTENNVRTINFMKVDVEGFEYEVLDSNDWKKFRPQVICIEANHIVKNWRPILQKNNYRLAFFDGLNEYYVAQEHKNLAQDFSYVETILARQPITEETYNELFAAKRNELALTHQKDVAESLRQKIYDQQKDLDDYKRVRILIIKLIRALHLIVLIHIKKLDKPKVNKVNHPVGVNAGDYKKTLKNIRKYDLERYFNTHTRRSFQFVNSTYLGLSKLLRRTALKAFIFLKGSK